MAAKQLRLNLESEPRSLDPRVGGDRKSQVVVRMLYEGLFRIGPDDKPCWGCAKSYKRSPDHMTYNFYLRRSTWPDGSPVTAHDFEKTWKSMLDPNFQTHYTYGFNAIKGATFAKLGQASIDDVGIRAVNDTTLVVELEHPAPYLIELLANPIFSPLPGGEYIPGHGNGPFILKKHITGREIVVDRNDSYWDAGAVEIDRIRLSIVEDDNTGVAMFERGELDWAGAPLCQLPLESQDQYERQGVLRRKPISGSMQIGLNAAKPPFHSATMRRAFAHAVNRKQLIDNLLRGEQRPALSILPPDMTMLESAMIDDGNIERARELFDQALKEEGITKEDLPPITLSHSTMEGHRVLAQSVADQLKRVFNIPIKLEACEWNVYFTKFTNSEFQIWFQAWYSWFDDPIYTLNSVREMHNGFNNSSWEHPEYRRLLDESDEVADTVQRRQLLANAEHVVMTEMPVIPLYFHTYQYVRSPKVHGVFISNTGFIDFRWTVID